MKYETVIGREVHIELASQSKIFCSCSAKFGGEQNDHVCPACCGMPGMLPVVNKKVVDLGMTAGMMLGCHINRVTTFDKKSYYYPDLPCSYQTTQWFSPVAIEEAGMIAQLRDDTAGIRGLGKVEKVYLDNPNLIYSLADKEINIGNLRETFFLNQMRVNNHIVSSAATDFMIDNRYFEIGGRSKGNRQIQNLDKAYVVKDDIELSSDNILPLWWFGLNY